MQTRLPAAVLRSESMCLIRNALKRELHAISKGKQIACKGTLAPPADEQNKEEVPAEIQAVIDKHATTDRFLNGDIPCSTTAKGFEMQRDLASLHIVVSFIPRPVRIKQYRLTPLTKTEKFLIRGWFKPSTSAWNSPVLFIPKPYGPLRFCVDFRALNQHTRASPIADQRDVPDALHGAKSFSASDLFSGFYQIPLAQSSSEYTAFSTPRGLHQWCVLQQPRSFPACNEHRPC
jgi:hypothetical protein